MTKRKIRENLYIMLFQTTFYAEDDWAFQADLFLEDLEGKDATKKAKTELKERFGQICIHLSEIDERISEKSKGWRLERLAKTDLAILRLAVFEMLFDEDVPNPVAINEAVELAKKYGEEKSGGFVNGVLASIEKEMEKNLKNSDD
ncbi:MAG: transcription antitermination factor NusB [Lachnospiraceae bacterium]|nr:transcription antitermination factor NusB [Lachnospiraceae bacterium]